MSWLRKNWFHIILFSLLVGFLLFTYKAIERRAEKIRVEKNELNQLRLEVGRAHTIIDETGEQLEEMKQIVSDQILEDLNSHDADVLAIGNAHFVNTSSGGGNVKPLARRSKTVGNNQTVGSTVSSSNFNNGPAPADEPTVSGAWEYKDWRLTGQYSPNDTGGQFTYQLNQEFELVYVEGQGDDGHPSYVELYELNAEGKRPEKPLTLKSFEVVRAAPKAASFHWWAPHIDVALGRSITDLRASGEWRGEVAGSVMGYGPTANDLSWRFLRVGASLSSDSEGLVACPVSYNVGDPLPLFSNIWLSPCYLRDGTNGASVSLGANL